MNPAPNPTSIEGQQIALRIAELMDDKKGTGVIAIDVRGIANFTDYFVICSGSSDRQVKAIHDAIREGMKEEFSMLPIRTEGERERHWVLLDYGDCIAHVMLPETREYYRLEQLWGDAPQLALNFTPAGDRAAGSPF